MNTSPKSRAPLYALAAIVAIIAGAISAQFMQTSPAPAFVLTSGTTLPQPRALPEFTLVNHRNESFTRQQLMGHWSLVFFGYTNCPDVCPTTLSMLAQVDKALADIPADQHPQMVFISVDPKRDTAAQLSSYVSFFNPAFIGVTGEQAQLDTLTHAMGAPVIISKTLNGNYTVDHSAMLFLVDPQARMAGLFSPPHQVSALVQDLRQVINSTK